MGQFHRLCLQIVWQHSQRHKVVGVLGSPEMNFVANGQTRIKSALVNAQCKEQPQPPKAIR